MDDGIMLTFQNTGLRKKIGENALIAATAPFRSTIASFLRRRNRRLDFGSRNARRN
jgi:hypothetical protein